MTPEQGTYEPSRRSASPATLHELSVLVVYDHTDSRAGLVSVLGCAIVVGVRTPKAAMAYAAPSIWFGSTSLGAAQRLWALPAKGALALTETLVFDAALSRS